jgi:gliding motility-associated-like protein
MKRFQLLCLFLFVCFPVFSQIDTEFWFAVPEITSDHADRPVFLRISTFGKASTIRISLPANPLFTPITTSIPANSTSSIDLTNFIANLENNIPNAVRNTGIYLTATNEVTAYYEVYGTTATFGPANTDIFTLKGRNALGTEFYTPFQNFWNNHPGINAWSSFDIVATEDNTIISITPSCNIVGHLSGVPFSILLNKGQTYSARATSILASEHPGGSYVSSTKPVAITIKDDSIEEGINYDLVGDQIIPINIIGTEYIAINSSSTIVNDDKIFICATQNNTDIFLDGNATPVTTLSAGQIYGTTVAGVSTYIVTSLPCYVLHISGMGGELGGALLPPLACTGSKRVSFARDLVTDDLSPTDVVKLNITVKSGYQYYFKLNGLSSAITSSLFYPVPGTGGNWVAGQLTVPTTLIPFETIALIQNDSANFHLGLVHGIEDRFFEYGFFSDYGHLDLGSDKYFCKNDSVELDAGFDKDSYTWRRLSNPAIIATSQTIFVSDTGSFVVNVTKGACTFNDTITLFYNPPVGHTILGNDTAICSNVSFIIRTDTIFQTYRWQNGSTAPTFKPQNTNYYYVDVSNVYGCKKRDSIFVKVNQAPKPGIVADKALEAFCADSLIHLDAGPGFSKYLWMNGDTTQLLTGAHMNEDVYWVTVTDSNECIGSHLVDLDCSIFIEVPNLFTPNFDLLNDVFFLKGLRPNKWSLEVYNRWGNRVFYNKNYDNLWDGNGSNDGIYYYSLKHNRGKVQFKGWVEIIR